MFRHLIPLIYFTQQVVKLFHKTGFLTKETVKAMKEIKKGKGVKFNSVDELFQSI